MSDYFGENKPQKDFTKRSLRGGAVSVVARAINALLQVGSVVFLARLLTPEDYGLVSMVSAVVGIAPLLIDLGTRDAVIQQPTISRGEISTLFWMTFALGLLSASLITVCGPVIANFYGEPRLVTVAAVSSLSVVALALSYQHQSLLRRAMKYQRLALIDVASNAVGTACALIMAFRGWGYWALVLRPVVSNAVVVIGVWFQCRWLPGKPAFTSGVTEMVRYGVHCIGYSGVDFITRYGDRVAIGHGHGAVGLGFYQKASLVYENFLDLTVTPLHGVAMTGLSKLREDVVALRRSWSRAVSTLTFYAMPAFGLLAVVSHDVIVLVLGERWAYASEILAVLSLRGIPHVVERTAGWLHAAAGRSDRFMRWGIVAAIAQLSALFIGLPFGPSGVAWAYVICSYLLFLPAISFSGKPFGIGPKEIMNTIGPQMIGALAATALGFALRNTAFIHLSRIQRTLSLASSYTACYGVIVVGLFKVRAPLEVSRSVFRAFAPS